MKNIAEPVLDGKNVVNPLERSQRIVLNTIGLFLLVSSLVGTVFWIYSDKAIKPFGVIVVFTSLLLLGLLRSRYWRLANLLYPTILLVFLVAQAYYNDGLFDEMVYGLFAVTAIAGLLLRRQGVIVFTILSVLSVIWLGYAHITGLIAKYVGIFHPQRILFLSVMVALGGALLYLVIDDLVATIDRLNENEKRLEANNRELVLIRESLEKQVIERTAAAESARIDSENARQAAEAQAWFTRGQAQLAERMRGDQSIDLLASNVTTYLCKYLDAQTGALYLASGNELLLTGHFAYFKQPDRKKRFLVGENLVGMVAKTRHAIKLNNIPDSAPIILSALGDTRPKEILIAPIETAGQVLGVVELATLKQFSTEHELFLERVSESIAIAIRTAQTRVQISDLLDKEQKPIQD